MLHARSISNISQPTSSYLEAYDKTLKQIESLTIDHTKLARAEGLATILAAGDPLNKLLGANFIVECGGFIFNVD